MGRTKEQSEIAAKLKELKQEHSILTERKEDAEEEQQIILAMTRQYYFL